MTTVTETATVEEGGESEGAPKPTVDGGESDRGSSAPTRDEAIAEAAAELPSECRVLGQTNWDDSSDLTFATFSDGGRACLYVALFHKGEFVGFPLRDEYSINYAKAVGDEVEVGVHDTKAFLESGDPLAFADQYNVPVMFYWDGSDFAYRGELPEKYEG